MFKVGDVVLVWRTARYLEGPKTVHRVANGMADCVWSEDGDVAEESFAIADLELIEPEFWQR